MTESDEKKGNEILTDPQASKDSVKSITTVGKIPKFDVGDVAIERFWMEHKEDKNWSSSILEQQKQGSRSGSDSKESDKGPDVNLASSTEGAKTKTYDKKYHVHGYTLPTNLYPQQADEVQEYITHRTREEYELYMQGKIAVTISEKTKLEFEESNKRVTVRSRQRFVIFVGLGFGLVAIGLSLVLYTYTFYYTAGIRITGATLLNVGLLLEIFSVAGWNGGTF